jgi:DNA-binding transcriptional MerR regulator
VANRDSAFLWETEVLRSAPRQPVDSAVITDEGEWLTIREASDATGVPTSTIRKWARHDKVPSYLERTEDGHLRLVSMAGIQQWTEEIGRSIDDISTERIDLTDSTTTTKDDTDAEPEVPEGTMLVPLDAWNKVLMQLGNLHEAGQQLAEARERAAKAETEAAFLRERLSDLRSQLDEAKTPEVTEAASGSTETSGPQPVRPGGLLASMREAAMAAVTAWRDRHQP